MNTPPGGSESTSILLLLTAEDLALLGLSDPLSVEIRLRLEPGRAPFVSGVIPEVSGNMLDIIRGQLVRVARDVSGEVRIVYTSGGKTQFECSDALMSMASQLTDRLFMTALGLLSCLEGALRHLPDLDDFQRRIDAKFASTVLRNRFAMARLLSDSTTPALGDESLGLEALHVQMNVLVHPNDPFHPTILKVMGLAMQHLVQARWTQFQSRLAVNLERLMAIHSGSDGGVPEFDEA